jgi:hypothetical protein
MFDDTSIAGVAKSMSRLRVSGDCYRLIPSHFPPIQLFEDLLDPSELEAAYALESLTNERLRQEVGDISLVPSDERIIGPGSTPIMAAFTHIGVESRFTKGRYGVYYAGLDMETAMAESRFSRARFLSATNEPRQVLTMRCYQCRVDADLVDVTGDSEVHNPDNFAPAQAVGEIHKNNDEQGILYNSVRHRGGQCIAIFKPTALVPPALQAGHFQFHWDGQSVSHVLSVDVF